MTYRIIGPALLSALVLLALCLWVLSFGHPHEDGYILYIFSENLGQTGAITYYDGGPPAEGATDFLWMAVIGGLNFLGLNTALSAALLNSIGAGVIIAILLQQSEDLEPPLLLGVLMALFVPVYAIGQSSVAGFSTMLYAALMLGLFALAISTDKARNLAVPVVALVMALFRPDGAIIGVVMTLCVACFMDRASLRKYLLVMLACGIVGAAYFVWRWQYFGEVLPLPLLVKSTADGSLPGYWQNRSWALDNALLVVLALVSIGVWRRGRVRLMVMTLPAILLLVALLFAFQSQNVSYRFQAPASVLLLFGSFVTLAYLLQLSRRSGPALKYTLVAAVALIGAYAFAKHLKGTHRTIGYLTNSDYINYFPYHLRGAVPDTARIALTEAGRFAYWLPGAKYDLVGLNTAETAKQGASVAYLEALAPDIIFAHHAGTLAATCPDAQDFCQVTPQRFDQIARASGLDERPPSANRIFQAPVAVARYLQANPDDYAIFFVFYAGDYAHLYALRKGGAVDPADFTAALQTAFSPAGRLSYFDMIGQ